MSAVNDCQSVIFYLKSRNIEVPSDWVVGCIQSCKSNKPDLSNQELKEAVFQQWLSTNLRELKIGSLPPDLNSCTFTILNGTYVVQVESMVDSSKSCYSQLQTIQQQGNDDIEVTAEPVEKGMKSNRCLTLVLCDGVQEVQAMEYQLISSLNFYPAGFVPGFKMLIIGPVTCRKGILLLKEENVKVYGGRVEDLYETNNLESILCKRLNLNVNKANHLQNNNEITNVENNVNDDFYNPDIEVEDLGESSRSLAISSVGVHSVEVKVKDDNVNNVNSISDNHNHFSHEMNSDYEQTANRFLNSNTFEEVDEENEIKRTKKLKLDNSNKFININSSDKNNWSESILMSENSSRPLKNRNEFIPVNTQQEIISMDEDNFDGFDYEFEDIPEFVNDSEIFKNMSQGDYESNVEVKISPTSSISKYPTEKTFCKTKEHVSEKISSYPYVYLKQLSNFSPCKPVTFVAKAIILTLKSKISIKNDEFMLTAGISDGSYTMDVTFSSDILENILGYSPCEISAMMSEKSRNLAQCERLKEIFSSAQQKLLSINCLMHIKFSNETHIPCVTSVEEVKTTHLTALKNRACSGLL